jgi:hypothetical protein
MVAVSVALEGEIMAMVSLSCRYCAESVNVQQSINNSRHSFFIFFYFVAKIRVISESYKA